MANSLKSLVKDWIPPILRRTIKRFKSKRSSQKNANTPEQGIVSAMTKFGQFAFIEEKAFRALMETVFTQNTYAFHTDSKSPRILDCGANIGVTVRYWKYRYPEARVTAFEPDPDIFKILQTNTSDLLNTELVQAALWSSEGELSFVREGKEGGHIETVNTNETTHSVDTLPTKRLRDYLNEPIELLKIDIEGAEFEVLEDCKEHLHNVKNLFVEHHSFLGQPQRLAYFFNILENAGFRIHVHVDKHSPTPLLEKTIFNEKDLWLNIFCTR